MRQSESIKRIKAQLAGQKRGRRFIDYRESGSYARKLEALVCEIDRLVEDPRLGVELVAAFIETDSAVLGRADDSNGSIGDVYSTDACDIFLRYATQCKDKAWLCDLLLRLYEHDEYCVRDSLIANAACFLPEPMLRGLVDEFWSLAEQMSDDYQRFHWLLGIEAIARQLKDARLFEQACLAKWPELPTTGCLDIAEVHFESGDANSALKWLERVPHDETFKADERDRLLLKITVELGFRDKAEEVAWRIFRRCRDGDTLELLLKVVGPEKREQIIHGETEAILRLAELSYSDVVFLIDMERLDDAERCVTERYEQLDGDYYTQLLPWAKVFETHGRPIVTCLIYRALLASILGRGQSRYYHHGVRYLRKLDELAPKVSDWGELVSHPEYMSNLLLDHKRKVSFWARYKQSLTD